MTHENLNNNHHLLLNCLSSCIYVNNVKRKGNSIYFEILLKKKLAQIFVNNLGINTRKNIHGQVSQDKLSFILNMAENQEVIVGELEKTFAKISQYLDYTETSNDYSGGYRSVPSEWTYAAIRS